MFCNVFFQRRSLAPSQIGKKIDSPVSIKFQNSGRPKRTREKSEDNSSKYRKPLSQLKPANEIVFASDHVKPLFSLTLNFIRIIFFILQEEIIKKLSRPFKCPIPNYVGGNSTRNLGIKRAQVRRALYDPNTPNALVLYAPPEISEHDKLKTDQ